MISIILSIILSLILSILFAQSSQIPQVVYSKIKIVHVNSDFTFIISIILSIILSIISIILSIILSRILSIILSRIHLSKDVVKSDHIIIIKREHPVQLRVTQLFILVALVLGHRYPNIHLVHLVCTASHSRSRVLSKTQSLLPSGTQFVLHQRRGHTQINREHRRVPKRIDVTHRQDHTIQFGMDMKVHRHRIRTRRILLEVIHMLLRRRLL